MLFEIDNAQAISESKPLMGVGLHKGCIATSCEKKEVGDDEKKIIEWTFENKDGEIYNFTEWEPSPEDAERGEWAGGGIKASFVDHMLYRVNLIVSSINPEIQQTFKFKDWDDIRDFCVKSFVKGSQVDLKLLDFRKNKAGVKKFIVAFSEDGQPYVSGKKKFIGKNLTITAEELTTVEALSNATPDSGADLGGLELPDPNSLMP